ncbi:uncharacterized protein LOC106132993 [Amyelois transitella]|uniref:uncharacterized protein LOC106132993 n=1 Tax=Amyelois transitella TaxID=680683 RepID=UPI00067D905A|nr:uncharacterized protein LOC106132993 [Amyelois transitella]
MYKILILICVIHGVVPHWYCSRHDCHRQHHQGFIQHQRVRTFEHLAKQVINLDKKTKELCVENSNNKTTEDYNQNDYKVTVNLPGYKEDEITVKHKHRVLYINAEKYVDGVPEIYFEVRVIPEVASLVNASWYYVDEQLKIIFPYKTREDYATQTCNLVIDETVKTVPKYVPELDVRFQFEATTVSSRPDDNVNIV